LAQASQYAPKLPPAQSGVDPALEPCGQGLIRQGRADDRLDDFMQVCEALNGIGQGLLVDLGVLGADAALHRKMAQGTREHAFAATSAGSLACDVQTRIAPAKDEDCLLQGY
jgi:hypothetical protein